MEEHRLISLIKEGYIECFQELIQYHEEALYKYCYYITGDKYSAEELFQDTWVKVMKNIHKYSEEYKFKNWILSIANNLFKDSYRKKKRWGLKIKEFSNTERMDKELNDVALEGMSPEDNMVLKDDLDLLKEKIKNMKYRFKAVILLYYFQEKSLKEISQILDIPEGTVKSRLNKGRKILREELEVYEFGREKACI